LATDGVTILFWDSYFIRYQTAIYPLPISVANPLPISVAKQLFIRCQYPLPNSYLSVANPLPISATKQLFIRCQISVRGLKNPVSGWSGDYFI
jgi:hypothetical protein